MRKSRAKGWAATVCVAAVAGLLSLQAVADLRGRQQQPMLPALFEEVQPVALVGCEMNRFGAERDGGYLLCGNLLGEVRAAYSYGIAGRDSWGCALSRRHDLTVHQYDCFNTDEPTCSGGDFAFHRECVGDTKETVDSREFDTVASQVAKNGDGGKRLVVKMDVEGAEWDSLLAVPDSLLKEIDQLVVEFHLAGGARYLDVVRKLKTHFHVANLHFNNYSCRSGVEPFPAWAWEVLFVNKRIAEEKVGATPALPHPLDRPNTGERPDCQTVGSQ